jgi:hypothetical protein
MRSKTNTQRHIAGKPPLAEHCWFSDGGLSSNFPLQFFDAPFPRWPTFAIELDGFEDDADEADESHECQNTWMAKSNLGGILESWNRFGSGGRGQPLLGFAGAIFDNLQNWNDNAQAHLPGNRDRIVHILLKSTEGGLNLNMDPKVLGRLAVRGTCAAQSLIEHFAQPDYAGDTTWDNQRWIRYRTSMALTEQRLRSMAEHFDDPRPGDRSYSELIARARGVKPTGYPWHRNAQRDFATASTDEAIAMARRWEQGGESLTDGAPKPSPLLQTRPKL